MNDLKKEFNQIRGLFWAGRDDFLQLAADEFVECRKSLGHKVYLNVSVLVPVCQDCRYTYRYTYPELGNKWLPDVDFSDWQMDLLLLGFPTPIIEQLKEDVEDGVEPERGPWCYFCGCWVPYWRSEDDGCYILQVPFREYFGFDEQDYPSVTKSMRERVRRIYRQQCFGCGIQLKDSEVTMDHVVAKSRGGTADLFNLQVLCQACNQEKADDEVDVKDICLHFPVRPLPSDSYEGATW